MPNRAIDLNVCQLLVLTCCKAPLRTSTMYHRIAQLERRVGEKMHSLLSSAYSGLRKLDQ